MMTLNMTTIQLLKSLSLINLHVQRGETLSFILFKIIKFYLKGMFIMCKVFKCVLDGFSCEEETNLRLTPFVCVRDEENRQQLEEFYNDELLEVLYSFDDNGMYYYQFHKHLQMTSSLDTIDSDFHFIFDIRNLENEPGKLISATRIYQGEEFEMTEQEVQQAWVSVLALQQVAEGRFTTKATKKADAHIKENLQKAFSTTSIVAFAFNSRGDLRLFKAVPTLPEHFAAINDLPTFYYALTAPQGELMDVIQLVKEVVPQQPKKVKAAAPQPTPKQEAPYAPKPQPAPTLQSKPAAPAVKSQPAKPQLKMTDEMIAKQMIEVTMTRFGKSLVVGNKTMNDTYFFKHLQRLNGTEFSRNTAVDIMRRFMALDYTRGEDVKTDNLSLVTLIKITPTKRTAIYIGYETVGDKKVFRIHNYVENVKRG